MIKSNVQGGFQTQLETAEHLGSSVTLNMGKGEHRVATAGIPCISSAAAFNFPLSFLSSSKSFSIGLKLGSSNLLCR